VTWTSQMSTPTGLAFRAIVGGGPADPMTSLAMTAAVAFHTTRSVYKFPPTTPVSRKWSPELIWPGPAMSVKLSVTPRLQVAENVADRSV